MQWNELFLSCFWRIFISLSADFIFIHENPLFCVEVWVIKLRRVPETGTAIGNNVLTTKAITLRNTARKTSHVWESVLCFMVLFENFLIRKMNFFSFFFSSFNHLETFFTWEQKKFRKKIVVCVKCESKKKNSKSEEAHAAQEKSTTNT